jgi:ATP-dependent RNA circularization protein (DNA/RNA ligase family)
MTEPEQLEIAAVIVPLIQRISNIEAKAKVNEMLIQILLQDINDLNKLIPNLEKVACNVSEIFNPELSELIRKEFQQRLDVLRAALQKKQTLKNQQE